MSSFQRVLCYGTGFNRVELGPEDVSLLERCPLLGAYLCIVAYCLVHHVKGCGLKVTEVDRDLS